MKALKKALCVLSTIVLLCAAWFAPSAVWAQPAPEGAAPAAPPPPPPPPPPPEAGNAETPADETAPPPEAPSLGDSLSGLAKAEYAAARILYEDGDYAGALTKLQRAYELSNDPRLLWNMAACYKNLRRYSQVITHVDRYLKEGASLLTPQDREDARALLDTVREFVADLTVTVDQPGALIYVDDQQVGTSPLSEPLHVDMGRHTLAVRKQGFVDFSTTLELQGGVPARIQVPLARIVHEGSLRVVAGAKDTISVDGRVVGTGLWTGKLKSGPHSVEVTAPGKLSHRTEVVVRDNDLNTLHVTLQDEPRPVAVVDSGTPAWVWIAGGVLAVGAGVGAYALFSSGSDDPQYREPTSGSWGIVDLP